MKEERYLSPVAFLPGQNLQSSKIPCKYSTRYGYYGLPGYFLRARKLVRRKAATQRSPCINEPLLYSTG